MTDSHQPDKVEREQRHSLACLREQADLYCKGEEFPRVMMEELCERFLVLADQKPVPPEYDPSLLFPAPSPLGDLADVIAEYDRIVNGRLDPRDAEADFVMRGSDWRVIRKAFASASHGATSTDPTKLRGEERQRYIHEHDCPRVWDFFKKHSLGSKLCPSCLLCGHQEFDRERWAITHGELPDIYICRACVDSARASSASARPINEKE